MSLKELKKIRKQRMERTYIELQVSKQKLKDSENKLAQAKSQRDEFHRWRLEHQETLFNGLQDDYFSPEDLKNYLMKLDNMKLEEQLLVEKIPILEKEVEEVKVELFNARQRLENVNRELEKVNEFLDIEAKEGLKIEELKEEDEVDELSSFRASK